MELEFYSVDVALPRRPKGLDSLLNLLFKKEKTNCSSLTYVFCSDEYLLKINRDYLKHEDYTDIITFDLSDTQRSVIGEVYISTERVRANAKELKFPVKEELLRVMLHGALHLCGYKDKTKADQQTMRERENHYLKLLNQAQ